MPIITSTITAANYQSDGRLSITERHVDATGKEYSVSYLCDAAFNTAVALSARVTTLNVQLKEEMLKGLCTIYTWDAALQDVTSAELIAYVRGTYKIASRDGLAALAKRILEWITNGRFTDTQFRTDFGLTVTQWNNLKAKMQVLANALSALELATGE